jgi:hypothetical protein
VEFPENPQQSKECMLKNLRVSLLKKPTMKKASLLIAAICIIVSNLQAQTQLEKGKIMVGVSSTLAVGGAYDSNLMSLGFSKTKYKHEGTSQDEYSSFVFNILPKGGYFIMDNLAAGLEVIITGYTDKSAGDGDKYTESTLGVGPFVRYYYPLDKIYPFAEAEVLFGSCRETWLDSNEKSGMFMFGVSLGAAVPLGEMVTFDLMAGYLRASYKYTGEVADDVYHEIIGGVGLRIGITVYLWK